MSKKKLQVEAIANELEGASLYFNRPPTTAAPSPQSEQSVPKPSKEVVQEETLKVDQKSDTLGLPTIKQDSMNASMIASTSNSNREVKRDDIVETIRKTVKKMGKEVSFIRLTPDEKHELSSLVFTFNELYRGDGRKTSENEIGRIALNYLLVDYRENGELSVLARVLDALNA